MLTVSDAPYGVKSNFAIYITVVLAASRFPATLSRYPIAFPFTFFALRGWHLSFPWTNSGPEQLTQFVLFLSHCGPPVRRFGWIFDGRRALLKKAPSDEIKVDERDGRPLTIYS